MAGRIGKQEAGMTGEATPGARSALVADGAATGASGGRRPDASGEALAERLEALGFAVERRVVPDECAAIAAALVDGRGGAIASSSRPAARA